LAQGLAAADGITARRHEAAQDAFANAAIGNAQPVGWPDIENGFQIAQPATTRSDRSRPMHGTPTRSAGDRLLSRWLIARMSAVGTISPSTARRSYWGRPR
jgi:hypothetical protein